MSQTQRAEMLTKLAAEEAALTEALARGDLMAARDCEAAYTRISDELAADEK